MDVEQKINFILVAFFSSLGPSDRAIINGGLFVGEKEEILTDKSSNLGV